MPKPKSQQLGSLRSLIESVLRNTTPHVEPMINVLVEEAQNVKSRQRVNAASKVIALHMDAAAALQKLENDEDLLSDGPKPVQVMLVDKSELAAMKKSLNKGHQESLKPEST